MIQPTALPPSPPLVAVSVGADGRVQMSCGVPKLEAVKLLLNIVEELRIQAVREESRLIQLAPPVALTAPTT
jgi:hypothetical protein